MAGETFADTAAAEAKTLFAQALQLFPPKGESITDESPILDPSTGLPSRFYLVCKDRYAELDEASQSRPIPEGVLALWQLEQNSWDLIMDLYIDRTAPEFEGASPTELIQANPYTPENILVRRAIEIYPSLNELLIVRNWLQRTAPRPSAPEPRRGYWRLTKLELVHQLRSKGPQTKANSRPFINSLVRELDPDVVTRNARSGHPVVLEPKDAEFEKSLSQSLYNHVRAGELDLAIELCRSVDQPWRSASLRGAQLFTWNNIAPSSEEEPEPDAIEEDVAHTGWSGNPRRALWRKACQSGATNPGMSTSARLLLSSLAPSSATLPTLSLGLTTWEDHLWARVSALFEDRLDVLLSRYGGFWSANGINATGDDKNMNVSGDDDEAVFEEQIDITLKEMTSVKVNSRFDFSDRFHWAQYHIITNRTKDMFNQYAEYLSDAPAGSREYSHHVRFFAHLCLFLRQIGQDVPLDAANSILQAYIALLEEERRGDLVALYVGALGENAIERYAAFLANLSIDTSTHERMLALNRARDHGLDVVAVAFSTASLIARDELKKLPTYPKEIPSLSELDMGILPAERVLCRSVEWLTFHPDNYEAALRQANALLRYLLGFARMSAARELLGSIPPEVTSEAVNYKIDGPELVHFRNFFEVWDGFATLVQVRDASPTDPAQKLRYLDWQKQYSRIVDGVREACENLFTSGWLTPLEDTDYDERRADETRRIRQIFIPDLVLRLHQELFVSRHLFPTSIKHIYRLSTIVADERYLLYRDFFSPTGGDDSTTTNTSTGVIKKSAKTEKETETKTKAKWRNRMPEYLFAIREAALGALEGGNKDPFSSLV